MSGKGGLIIAIDGYSSCGKSSFAKALAARLGYVFIDTGAMYRAVTLYALRLGFGGRELQANIDAVHISFAFNAELGRSEIFLDGENVDSAIRSVEVNNSVSSIASMAAVRQKLVDMQREMGHGGGVVMDGRDIGTVVFPDADIKIFMTADPAIRARAGATMSWAGRLPSIRSSATYASATAPTKLVPKALCAAPMTPSCSTIAI